MHIKTIHNSDGRIIPMRLVKQGKHNEEEITNYQNVLKNHQGTAGVNYHDTVDRY